MRVRVKGVDSYGPSCTFEFKTMPLQIVSPSLENILKVNPAAHSTLEPPTSLLMSAKSSSLIAK